MAVDLEAMPRAGVKKPDEMALAGLAESWNRSSAIRSNMLKSGRVLYWESPKLVGVVNLDTLSGNWRPMKRMMEIWLPKLDVLKTINV